MRRRRAFSRVERETMIITTFAIAIQRGFPNELTMYDIARALDMSPSMHLMRILWDMEKTLKLTVKMVDRRGRYSTWMWSLPEGSYHHPRRNRTIALNVRGKQVDQLELF